MRILSNDEASKVAESASIQRVPSGFPSPAEDTAERRLNLVDLLASRPSVYFLEMSSDAMAAAGIFAGDVLVVDRALTPLFGHVAVVELAGKFVTRYYCPEYEAVYLLPASDDFAPLYIAHAEECVVWGIVTATIHRPPLLDAR